MCISIRTFLGKSNLDPLPLKGKRKGKQAIFNLTFSFHGLENTAQRKSWTTLGEELFSFLIFWLDYQKQKILRIAFLPCHLAQFAYSDWILTKHNCHKNSLEFRIKNSRFSFEFYGVLLRSRRLLFSHKNESDLTMKKLKEARTTRLLLSWCLKENCGVGERPHYSYLCRETYGMEK